VQTYKLRFKIVSNQLLVRRTVCAKTFGDAVAEVKKQLNDEFGLDNHIFLGRDS
jgi:hypothetical protein